MAAALSGSSGRSNSQLTRSLERILDEAQLTGELHLSGRNCKEFPKVASKYDLYDTTSADLSKNRLSELPHEVCDFYAIEKIDCYHNVIRSIPESITRLQCLTHLNLSRNQLTTIPSVVCGLQNLHVLIVCHNKLVSLPEEIDLLQKLMELDVSCNEISHLPPQIGFLKSLRSLHLRRNMLVELPVEITALRLVLLDISSNRIVYLPARLRVMESLLDLILDNNPLSSPPAYLCTRGKVHIFKFLDIQAQKEDRKKGVLGLEYDYKRSQWRSNNSVDHRLNGLTLENRHKRLPVDSGYSTEGDMRWLQDSQELSNENEEGRKHTLKITDQTKEKRLEREKDFPKTVNATGTTAASVAHTTNPVSPPYEKTANGNFTNISTPSTLSPNSDISFENEISREMLKQRSQARKELQEINGDDHEEALLADERRKAAAKIWEQQQEEARRNSSQRNFNTATPSSIFSPRENYVISNDAADGSAIDSTLVTNERNSNPLGHIQTYREYKEALKMQRSYETNNVYRRTQSEAGVGVPPIADGLTKLDVTCFPRPPPMGAPSTNHCIAEEEYLIRPQETYSPLQQQQQQRYEAQIAQLRFEDEKRKQKQLQKEAVLSYVKSRTSPLKSSTDSDHYSSEDYGSKSSSPSLSPCPPPLTVSTSVQSLGSSVTPHRPQSPPPPLNGTIHHPPRLRYNTAIPIPQTSMNYTNRRETERIREEKEQIEQLRQAIELRLKVSLPDDLASALTDGVVLCHLANHVRPRSVASIHVPSPAVPKLTVAKCRRNVENFLEACRRIGVTEEHLCSCDDILNGLPKPRNVLVTVLHVAKGCHYKNTHPISPLALSPLAVSTPARGQDDVLISWLCIAIFFGSCLLLYFMPENA